MDLANFLKDFNKYPNFVKDVVKYLETSGIKMEVREPGHPWLSTILATAVEPDETPKIALNVSADHILYAYLVYLFYINPPNQFLNKPKLPTDMPVEMEMLIQKRVNTTYSLPLVIDNLTPEINEIQVQNMAKSLLEARATYCSLRKNLVDKGREFIDQISFEVKNVKLV